MLNKYYPPDYDPSKIPRVKRKTKQNDVRIMAPFNMRCKTCGNYIANATKFNAKKETVEDQTYNNLMIFRFYIKCPRCMATIIFKTNPKDQAYEVEHGATENFMALKMAEKQAREEAEAEVEEEKINPMKHLENRTKSSKQQMEASEQIQNLRSIKFQHHKVNLDALIASKREEIAREEAHLPAPIESTEISQMARLMNEKRMEKSISEAPKDQERNKRKAMSVSSLSDLKKRIKIVPKQTKNVSIQNEAQSSSSSSSNSRGNV